MDGHDVNNVDKRPRRKRAEQEQDQGLELELDSLDTGLRASPRSAQRGMAAVRATRHDSRRSGAAARAGAVTAAEEDAEASDGSQLGRRRTRGQQSTGNRHSARQHERGPTGSDSGEDEDEDEDEEDEDDDDVQEVRPSDTIIQCQGSAAPFS